MVIDLANSPSFEDKAVLEFFETSGRNLTQGGGGRGGAPRDPARASFRPRARLLAARAAPGGVLHSELAPLIGRALASAVDEHTGRLSTRLRQTLHCLLAGDGEKQAAARLGVSPATLHGYVTALYRRFGVHSRAQLLSLVLKRRKPPVNQNSARRR